MTSRGTLQGVQCTCRATRRLGRRPSAVTVSSLHELQANPSGFLRHLPRADVMPITLRWYAKCSARLVAYGYRTLYDRPTSLADAENWLALGTGALLLLVGASRRSAVGACLAVSSAPLLYRGITGHWPDVLNGSRPARQHQDRPRRRARSACSRIDSAGSARRRGLPLLASPREPAAVHDAPRPCDGDL